MKIKKQKAVSVRILFYFENKKNKNTPPLYRHGTWIGCICNIPYI